MQVFLSLFITLGASALVWFPSNDLWKSIATGAILLLVFQYRSLSRYRNESRDNKGKSESPLIESLENARINLEERAAELATYASELKRAKDAAEKTSLEKNELLASMSHEIRTPMNGILGMTELVLDSTLSIEQQERLNLVKISAEALLRIINDILDFSKIEADKLEIRYESFDLTRLLHRIATLMEARVAAKGLTLVLSVDPKVPRFVISDEVRIGQILTNLIGNSLKFTKRGGIVIQVMSEDLEHDTATVHFAVTDTGIGIRAERIEAIFDPFTQETGTTDIQFGGTGLGLTIARRLVRLLDGEIWVTTQKEIGSVFHFKLPLQFERGENKIPESDGAIEKISTVMNILVAEDNEINQKLIRALLQRDGHTVTIVSNGKEAFDLATTREDWDLVLMDCQMPVMDGYQSTVEIREAEKSRNKRIPIVALTAAAMEGDRKRCFESGMDLYLTKPIRVSELRDVLRMIGNGEDIDSLKRN